MNDKTLDPDDPENLVDVAEPHELCQVLTGALYAVMVKIHDSLKKRYAKQDGTSEFSASGKALYVGAERFKRMIFRALDYLPPGEISFADYGRAIIASDQASHPDATQGREWLREEFVRRGMAADRHGARGGGAVRAPGGREARPPDPRRQRLGRLRLRQPQPRLLRIPPDFPFRVRPRLDSRKTYYLHGGVKKPIRECIFKVSWDAIEPNPPGSWLPENRQITVGTTLAIDWETRKVRARLTSGWEAGRADRDALLQRLDRKGLLVPGRARRRRPTGRRSAARSRPSWRAT